VYVYFLAAINAENERLLSSFIIPKNVEKLNNMLTG